jgi:hypothetical protein
LSSFNRTSHRGKEQTCGDEEREEGQREEKVSCFPGVLLISRGNVESRFRRVQSCDIGESNTRTLCVLAVSCGEIWNVSTGAAIFAADMFASRGRPDE